MSSESPSRSRIPNRPPRSIGVIGGGTAGWFVALAVKRRFPRMDVAVVESSSIPIIGVGEATTTLMPPFLHAQLGLDIEDLFRSVRPTFKLGIRFEWGLPVDCHFNYPFGDADPIEAMEFDGDLHAQSLISLLMDDCRAPVLRGPDGQLLSLLGKLKFAYHLDNAPFVAFLCRAGERAGIAHLDAVVTDVELREDGSGISKLRTEDGRDLAFDLFVDATGFRSRLMEGALHSPFESYASSLFCDRALVATVPRIGAITPYTTAETMDAGWCWRIPTEAEDHRGYVYSSAFLDDDAARRELETKNRGARDLRLVRFRSGRHRDFWCGNTVAVGNAYGFVEPLESTALHMVIVEIGYLLSALETMGHPTDFAAAREVVNESVGRHWDYLRWFLAVHYKFNGRLDTPFWRAARDNVDVSGIAHVIERYRREGPWLEGNGSDFETGDPAFGFSGLMIMLLGQRVAAPRASVGLRREVWQERTEKLQRLVKRSLEHGDALDVLRSNPELLRQFADSSDSWCQADAERVDARRQMGEMIGPRSGMPGNPRRDELVRSVREGHARRRK